MYVRLLKSLNRLNPRAWDFIQLTRMDKPIGIYLLLGRPCGHCGWPPKAYRR